ncbi:MAG: TA system VapC family ribonuclease toxin [Cellulomonadaceae bacterium]
MRLVDANVLIYAVDESAQHHRAAKTWLDGALSSAETVLLPWISLLAFVRIVTHPRIYETPLSVDAALDVVGVWLSSPAAQIASGSKDTLRGLREHLQATGAGGNLVNDAYLAALARTHDATVVTFDADFGRFPHVRWTTPQAA